MLHGRLSSFRALRISVYRVSASSTASFVVDMRADLDIVFAIKSTLVRHKTETRRVLNVINGKAS